MSWTWRSTFSSMFEVRVNCCWLMAVFCKEPFYITCTADFKRYYSWEYAKSNNVSYIHVVLLAYGTPQSRLHNVYRLLPCSHWIYLLKFLFILNFINLHTDMCIVNPLFSIHYLFNKYPEYRILLSHKVCTPTFHITTLLFSLILFLKNTWSP